jgi:hypothetical protein
MLHGTLLDASIVSTMRRGSVQFSSSIIPTAVFDAFSRPIMLPVMHIFVLISGLVGTHGLLVLFVL